MKKYLVLAVTLLGVTPAFAGVAKLTYHVSKFAGKHAVKVAAKSAKVAAKVLY